MNPPLRVLHLEDDPKDTKLVQAALEKEGIRSELTRFEKEEDFTAALRQGSFDLILADYTLPSFDGFSALKIALQYSPDLPFIFVSGTLGEEVAIEALKTGATDYVLKTRLDKLGPAVKRAMREAREKADRKRAEEALRLSEHLARGQLEALQEALVSLSRDSEPEKFLQHVLSIVCRQLAAHSVSVWEVNDKASRLELAAMFEDDRLRIPSREETQPLPLGPELKDDSVWAEFFHTGERCVYSVIGESDVNPLKVREVMNANGPWHNGLWSPAANVHVQKTIEGLLARGVRASLSVPMIFSGKVIGMFGIRFAQIREFRQEEIELTHAMTHQAMLAMQLMRLSRQSRETAVIAERNRVARDLHDTLLQGFTGIGMKLEAMASSLPPSLASTREQLQKILEQSDEYLTEARRSVWGLRSPSLAELGDFPAALKRACERALQNTSIALRFTTRGAERQLTPGIEDNLLRISEEAVTNAVKHADPTEVEVALEYTAKELRLRIRDNGRGFDPHGPNGSKNGHFGLVGIRERAKVLAGNLSLDSQPGGGTEIAVTVNLSPES